MKKSILTLALLLLVPIVSFGQKPMHRDELVTVASFGKSMVIGLSVTSDNRVFVAFPGHNGDGNLALAEVKGNRVYPYPDVSWNQKAGEDTAHFLHVQDLYVDAHDRLWVLDSRPARGGNGKFKLLEIDTRTNKVENIYFFEDLDKSRSALNDVRVDLKNGLAYLSDPGQAAIVILNLTTGRTRSLLKNTEFTTADNIVLTYSGKEMKDGNGNAFSSNVNGIALTHDYQYLYFKPINQENLFRINTQYLADTGLSEDALEGKVENMGKVGVTHGLIADDEGNIYLTTSEHYAISYLSPDGKLHTLVQDSKLLWPDSMGIGSDGYLYVSCAQLQRLPNWNNGVDKTEYPYRIYKIKLPKAP